MGWGKFKDRLATVGHTLLQKVDCDPVCERVALVDGPGSPSTTCGQPADCVLTDPHCGHDTFVCADCAQLADRIEWWKCRECGAVTDCRGDRIPFRVWVP